MLILTQKSKLIQPFLKNPLNLIMLSYSYLITCVFHVSPLLGLEEMVSWQILKPKAALLPAASLWQEVIFSNKVCKYSTIRHTLKGQSSEI